MNSSNPVALITGGTTGIGHATAKLLHSRGWDVVVTGRNPETLEQARRTLPTGVMVLPADVRSITDSENLAREAKERFGRVDFLYLNAGISSMAPIEAFSESMFDDIFDTNVKGQFFTLQKVLPLLGKGGSVLWTTAVGVRRGFAGYAASTASKGATAAIVPSLANELAPRGIRVNAICPGPIDTPAMTKLGLPPEALAGFAEVLPQKVPAGRLGTPEDVAEVAAFLASPAAAYVTGSVFTVDGGMTTAF